MGLKSPAATAIIGIFLFISVFLLYFFMDSTKWKDYAERLEDQNTQLNETLMLTQEKLDNETSHSASLGTELAATKQTLAGSEASLENCSSELSEREDMLGVCTSRNEELSAFLLETRYELQNLSGELASFQD
ncbi:hypothetical protein H0O02_01475, partial [Candidatus Micrarchaeota archaeon]|nr:hypothetical protein [Candidatus Micrarchaeota archaeon]